MLVSDPLYIARGSHHIKRNGFSEFDFDTPLFQLATLIQLFKTFQCFVQDFSEVNPRPV